MFEHTQRFTTRETSLERMTEDELLRCLRHDPSYRRWLSRMLFAPS